LPDSEADAQLDEHATSLDYAESGDKEDQDRDSTNSREGWDKDREDDERMRFAKHPGSAPGARRRTTLSLSASDPELSMEYARLLKVLIYFKESVLCIYCCSG